MGTRQPKLVFSESDGKKRLRVEHQWRSIENLRQMTQVHDSVMDFAELPRNEDLPRMIDAAAAYGLPSISRRASPSPLEHEAALFITALASSSSKHWVQIVRHFLNQHGWHVDLHGRPEVPPDEVTDSFRGREIDRISAKLQKGFEIKRDAERRRRRGTDDDAIETALQSAGYNSDEIKAIMQARSLEVAACHLWIRTQKLHMNPRTIQNSYARYRQSKKPQSMK
jgi:hypothetical protein